MTDDDLAEYLAGGSFDPEFYYDVKKRALDKDSRMNKDSFSNIDAAYRDLVQYEQSNIGRNTARAKALLTDVEVSASDLRNTLQSVYGYSNDDVSAVLKNLSLSKDIDTHQNIFSRNVTFKKRLDH